MFFIIIINIRFFRICCILIQNSNYNSVSAFADLCEQYGFDGQIRRIENWGTFKDFQSENVLNGKHPNYELALIELKKVASRRLSNVSPRSIHRLPENDD